MRVAHDRQQPVDEERDDRRHAPDAQERDQQREQRDRRDRLEQPRASDDRVTERRRTPCDHAERHGERDGENEGDERQAQVLGGAAGEACGKARGGARAIAHQAALGEMAPRHLLEAPSVDLDGGVERAHRLLVERAEDRSEGGAKVLLRLPE